MTLLEKSRPYEPKVKPKLWNDDHYCDYCRNKDQKMEKA